MGSQAPFDKAFFTQGTSPEGCQVVGGELAGNMRVDWQVVRVNWQVVGVNSQRVRVDWLRSLSFCQ
jgi:hypothetical protein